MLDRRWAARILGGSFALLSWFFLSSFPLGRWASRPLRCAYVQPPSPLRGFKSSPKYKGQQSGRRHLSHREIAAAE